MCPGSRGEGARTRCDTFGTILEEARRAFFDPFDRRFAGTIDSVRTVCAKELLARVKKFPTPARHNLFAQTFVAETFDGFRVTRNRESRACHARPNRHHGRLIGDTALHP